MLAMKVIILSFFILCMVLVGGCVETPAIDDSLEKTEIMKEQQLRIYGTLTDIEQVDDLTRLFIDQELLNCKKKSSSVEISAIMYEDVDLLKSKKYLFTFTRPDENHDWSGSVILDGIDLCADFHSSDLYIDKKTEIDEGLCSKIVDNRVEVDVACLQSKISIIPLMQPTTVSVDLVNTQDVAINFRILDSALIDERVAKPFISPLEEPKYDVRLQNAGIDACKIDFNNKEQTIPANSRKQLSLTITCTEPIRCEKTYESCDINGENCKVVTKDECDMYLWGKISFVDSLGFEHIIPEKGILDQDIEFESESSSILIIKNDPLKEK